jgi:hypothetical protein
VTRTQGYNNSLIPEKYFLTGTGNRTYHPGENEYYRDVHDKYHEESRRLKKKFFTEKRDLNR